MECPDSTRIRELEGRVDVLTAIIIVQLIAFAFILRLVGTAIVSVLLLIPILAFTHKRIPGIARKCGRVFSFLSRDPSTSHEAAGTHEAQPAT